MNIDAHDIAMQHAMQLFWRKGYADTSMAEIVKVTGMNRYALYSRFGNKREVFLKTLALYFEEGRQTFQPIATDATRPPFDRIRECMKMMKAQLMSRSNGCFMCHVAIEECAGDPEIARAINSYFDQILDMMKVPLRDAQDRKELNPALTLDEAAQLLFNAKLSLGQYAKAGVSEDVIDRVITSTITALQTPNSPNERYTS